MTTANRLRHLLTYMAICLCFLLLTGAATEPGAPPPGWSMAEVMALIALIVAGAHALVEGARAILHFTAPRTKTTLDDRAAATLDSIHDRLTSIEALLPAKAPAPAPSSTTNIIGPIAGVLLVLLVGAASPACATLKEAPGAAKAAVIECGKEQSAPILQLAAQLAVQAALAALDQGAIDWPAIEEAAATEGKVVGGCALVRFIANLERAPRSDTAARTLAAKPDTVAEGRAAIARLSQRFDGATWSTP